MQRMYYVKTDVGDMGSVSPETIRKAGGKSPASCSPVMSAEIRRASGTSKLLDGGHTGV